jgi:hypothetical protein
MAWNGADEMNHVRLKEREVVSGVEPVGHHCSYLALSGDGEGWGRKTMWLLLDCFLGFLELVAGCFRSSLQDVFNGTSTAHREFLLVIFYLACRGKCIAASYDVYWVQFMIIGPLRTIVAQTEINYTLFT